MRFQLPEVPANGKGERDPLLKSGPRKARRSSWVQVRSVVKLGAVVREERGRTLREWAATFGITNKTLALGTVLAALIIDDLAHAMLLPVVPFYVLALGGAGSDIGLCFSLFAIFQGPAAYMTVRLSDHVGRKPMLLLAYIGSVIGHCLSASASSLLPLMAGRAVLGAFSSSDVLSAALITDLVAPSELPKYLGLLSVGSGVCLLIGPMLGALFTAGGSGVAFPFWVATVLSSCALALATILLPSAEQVSHEERRARQQAARARKQGLAPHDVGGAMGGQEPALAAAIRRRLLCVVTSAHLLMALPLTTSMTVLPLRLHDRLGLRADSFGSAVTLGAVASVLFQALLYESIVARLGILLTGSLVGGFLMLAMLLFSLLGFAPEAEGVWDADHWVGTAMAVLGLFGASVGKVLLDAVAPNAGAMCASEDVGAVMALNSLAASAGKVIGPLAFTFLYDFFGIHHQYHGVPFIVAAACALAGALLYMLAHSMAIGSSEVRRAQLNLEQSFANRAHVARFEEAMEQLLCEVREDVLQKGYDIAEAATLRRVIESIREAIPEEDDGVRTTKSFVRRVSKRDDSPAAARGHSNNRAGFSGVTAPCNTAGAGQMDAGTDAGMTTSVLGRVNSIDATCSVQSSMEPWSPPDSTDSSPRSPRTPLEVRSLRREPHSCTEGKITEVL